LGQSRRWEETSFPRIGRTLCNLSACRFVVTLTEYHSDGCPDRVERFWLDNADVPVIVAH
jgi:hypothetical protein